MDVVGAMSDAIPEIGRCIGCDRMARLYRRACKPCLTIRGRRWIAMSHQCRTDPEFALEVYSELKTDRAREVFLRMYGASALRGRGSTIAAVREKQSRRAGEREAEVTVPPPPRD
jgi:hypothetical protein